MDPNQKIFELKEEICQTYQIPPERQILFIAPPIKKELENLKILDGSDTLIQCLNPLDHIHSLLQTSEDSFDFQEEITKMPTRMILKLGLSIIPIKDKEQDVLTPELMDDLTKHHILNFYEIKIKAFGSHKLIREFRMCSMLDDDLDWALHSIFNFIYEHLGCSEDKTKLLNKNPDGFFSIIDRSDANLR